MSVNTIKIIYNTNSTISSNSGALSSSFVIFILVSIISYLYYRMIMKDISHDWETKKCSPRYIFYSGFFNSPTGDPIKDTYTNFINCTDPTKNTEGNNRFQIVFDTANTITNTANKIIEYSNSILNESDRIEEESKNNISFIREKTNVLKTSMNLLYNYQLKLYTILKMYFERIFLILDTFTQYTTDIKLYNLTIKKNNLRLNGDQLDPFINNILIIYNNIYDNELTEATTAFKTIKKNGGNNYHTEDYSEVINKCNDAYNKYDKLIKDIEDFDKENESKLNDIDTICLDLKNRDINYNSIFPFL